MSPAAKRTSSIVTSSEAETVSSKRSSSTQAVYRYECLTAAEIYIHTDPPSNIQAAIDDIIKAEVTEDRRLILRDIAKTLYEACRKTVQTAVGKDDFVILIHKALEAMKPDNILFRTKSNWREELKPVTQELNVDWSFLINSNNMSSDQQQEVDNTSAPPPPKRQQQSAGQPYISPQPSMINILNSNSNNRPPQSIIMPPPSRPLPAKAKQTKQTSPIKTPRPNISIGIEDKALISALLSQNLNNAEIKRFLKALEKIMIPSEQDGSAEQILIIIPTQQASGLVFPFAIVEGKAYSTGKQVFEAQNQAAVAGASGLKIQLSLNELVKRSTISSDAENQPPLFFSICTEGPYHELWVHYTHIEDDVREFNMKLLKICNGVLLEGVEDFLITVDNVLRWGTGQFLKSVVERLGKVARKISA